MSESQIPYKPGSKSDAEAKQETMRGSKAIDGKLIYKSKEVYAVGLKKQWQKFCEKHAE
jgi:hypothetical protein